MLMLSTMGFVIIELKMFWSIYGSLKILLVLILLVFIFCIYFGVKVHAFILDIKSLWTAVDALGNSG